MDRNFLNMRFWFRLDAIKTCGLIADDVNDYFNENQVVISVFIGNKLSFLRYRDLKF